MNSKAAASAYILWVFFYRMYQSGFDRRSRVTLGKVESRIYKKHQTLQNCGSQCSTRQGYWAWGQYRSTRPAVKKESWAKSLGSWGHTGTTGTNWILCLSLTTSNLEDAGDLQKLEPLATEILRHLAQDSEKLKDIVQVQILPASEPAVRDNIREPPPWLAPNTDFQSIKCCFTSTSPVSG